MIESACYGAEAPDVLLVEDDDDDALLFVRAIKAIKPTWSVKRLGDGGEARSFLGAALQEARSIPRIIFTDLQMPGMSGADLLRWIQERPEFEATKLFVISGHVAMPICSFPGGDRPIWFFPKPATGFSLAVGLADG